VVSRKTTSASTAGLTNPRRSTPTFAIAHSAISPKAFSCSERIFGDALHNCDGVEAPARRVYTLYMKRRIVTALQKYLLNPPIKLLFTIGLAPPGYALLETIGRKTGKPRRTPVGNGRVERKFWIVAEHGEKAGYVRNIANNPRVRLKLRDGLRTRWYVGNAHVLADDDPRERQLWLASRVRGSSSNGAAVRFFGTELLTVCISLDE
jgi:deazaflavin-dependent oxidoreductase (nitroreductase family)